jgi:hypothetical protein
MTKAQARQMLVNEVVHVRAVSAEVNRLQRVGELRIARAEMVATEMLDFDDLDDALATITDDEMEKARAGLLASTNGQPERQA